MRSVFDGYNKIDTSGETTFFAGANTGHGFSGCYRDIADERRLDRVYIIKGGSGTGKSTFIRRAARAASDAGFGVEYYLCGSDPYSLDCAVFDNRIAILDGTAPHVHEMTYPGASSELLDVTKFWNSDILSSYRQKISTHSDSKKALYSAAYRYLSAADTIDSERNALSEILFDREKANAFVSRHLQKLLHIKKPLDTESGSAVNRFDHAITMRGLYYVSDYFEYDTFYHVNDKFSVACLFMELLLKRLSEAGYDLLVCRIPAGYISKIALPFHGIAFGVTEPEAACTVKRINMERFIHDDNQLPDGVRGQIRLAARIAESCLSEASRNLSAASEHHFALEEIYKSAMDFDSLENYSMHVCGDIVRRLKRGY